MPAEQPIAPPLSGQVIVVIGGAGLIGRAVAGAVATQGAVVIVADRDASAAQEVAGAIRANGCKATGLGVDITSAASIDEVIGVVRVSEGRIDGVVNAAYPRNERYGRKLESVTYEDFCENVNLHLGGYFLVLQRCAKAFRESGSGGTVVSFGSIYGTSAPRFDLYTGSTMTMPVEYAAIKSGIAQLARYFAQYYKAEGIRFNTVSPGGIFNGQAPEFVARYRAMAGSKGMLDASDVAGAVIFLLSDAGRYVTGQNLIVDDGWSL